jgi:hypothetical protein
MDIVQMMYEFDVLMEEFQICRKYLTDLTTPITNREFYYTNSTDPLNIAYRFGYIAFCEKEIGKRIDMVFSFRLDIYDELFNVPFTPAIASSLPSRDKLLQYYHDIHDTFLSEIKIRKRAEVLFALLNQDYIQLRFIARRCQELDCSSARKKPESRRLMLRLENGEPREYYLPAYTN